MKYNDMLFIFYIMTAYVGFVQNNALLVGVSTLFIVMLFIKKLREESQ